MGCELCSRKGCKLLNHREEDIKLFYKARDIIDSGEWAVMRLLEEIEELKKAAKHSVLTDCVDNNYQVE